MVKFVKKRDGSIVPFEKQKIINAIGKAGFVKEDIKEKIADEILHQKQEELSVEDIQDLVEKKLMSTSYKDVAKKYIKYRYLHAMARTSYGDLMTAISSKLEADSVLNQNANIDEHSFGGRIGEAASHLMERYALDFCVTPKMREAHLNNEIYLHDLNSFAVGSHNCLTIPFDDLLKNGFNTRQTDVRPAKSVNTAFQLVAVISQLQSLQQFGGVAASHLDWTMVPYIRLSFAKHFKDGIEWLDSDLKDIIDVGTEDEVRERSIDDALYTKHPVSYKYALTMTTRELYQAVEGMYHNLNTLQSRSGNQLKCVAD